MHVGYTFARAHGVRASVLAEGTAASTPSELMDAKGNDDLVCVRLAVGLEL